MHKLANLHRNFLAYFTQMVFKSGATALILSLLALAGTTFSQNVGSFSRNFQENSQNNHSQVGILRALVIEKEQGNGQSIQPYQWKLELPTGELVPLQIDEKLAQESAIGTLVNTKVMVTVPNDSPDISITTTGPAKSQFIDPPVTSGDFKTLVVVIKIVDGTTQYPVTPLSAAQALNPVFNSTLSTKNFYSLASGGRLRIVGLQNRDAGDVAYVTINSPVDNCENRKFSQWETAVLASLRSQSIEPNNYNGIHFVYGEIPGCSNTSISTIGDIGSIGITQYSYHTQSAFLNPQFGTVTHETGHQLGLNHSSGYSCASYINFPQNCSVVEYGDMADVMAGTYMMLSQYQLRRLGWQKSAFESVTSSGTYGVYSPTTPSRNQERAQKSLKYSYIPLSGQWAGNSLYLEARTMAPPFDTSGFSGSLLDPYFQGVKLIYGTDNLTDLNARPYIILTKPTSTHPEYDAPLLNASLSVAGVSIQHTGVTNILRGSRVVITLP